MNKKSKENHNRKLENAIHDMKSRFESLADTSQEGIIIIDENYRIIFANKELLKMSGYEYSELINEDFRILLADESKLSVEEKYIKRQAGENVDSKYSFTMLTKEGARKHIALSAAINKTAVGKTETIAYVLDVTEKAKMENVLKRRLEFEQIIASISTIFINFSADRLDRMVSYALRKIADVNEFDHGYIYMFSTGSSVMELTHEWCRTDKCEDKKKSDELSTDALPWIQEKLYRQENIYVTNILEIPADAANEKNYFKNRGVKSFLIVPLIFNQSLTGFMGFESFREEKLWYPEDIPLMNLASETIINAYKRKWSERALKENEERFRGIYESANIGIYRYGRNYKIEMANPALLNMLGYKSFEDFSAVDMRKNVFADLNKRAMFEKLLLKTGNLSGYETQWLKADNTIIEMSESARAVKDEGGHFLGYEGFVENISEKKKSHELLLQAKDAAEKSSKMKSDFIQQMSHEIRTPITAILNNVNMLKYMLSSIEKDNYESQFNTITQGGMRLIRTIDLIIDMSEIQSNNYKPEIKRYDLYTDILRDLCEKYEQIAILKNISFVHETKNTPYFVTCDLYSARQIFEQVLDNAIKFTQEGKVEVNFVTDKETFSVVIEDTGIGISENYLAQIFEPFSQEEQGTNRRYEGNGLGLTLAYEFCRINKWQILIESNKSKSTTVKIILPKI